jgi:cytidyltransferase-like protein
MTALPTYVVAGSFNPFHLGHKFLIDSALNLSHNKVVVLQACNPKKPKPKNTIGVLRDIYESQVEMAVLPSHTMLAEYVVGNYENPILVRGYRDPQDQAYETTLMEVNSSMGLPTTLLPSPAELRNCSSSFIRGITGPGNVGFHNHIRHLMPKEAYTAQLETWISEHLASVRLHVPNLQEVFCLYRESHRYYHTLCHLAHAYQELARLRSTGMTISNEIDLALLFHDAVYNPLKTDNEDRSALLMRKHIGANGWESLILATAGHVPVGRKEEIMVACDLAILGRPAEEYRRYARGIRKEYSFVPDKLYRTERAKILQNLATYRFPDYWPDPAYNARLQSNIVHEILGFHDDPA